MTVAAVRGCELCDSDTGPSCTGEGFIFQGECLAGIGGFVGGKYAREMGRLGWGNVCVITNGSAVGRLT